MMQKIHLLRPWRRWIAGQEVETAPHIAAQLIAGGTAQDASVVSIHGHVSPVVKAVKPAVTPDDEAVK